MLKKILHVLLNWFLPRSCCVCNSLANVETLYQNKMELIDLCQKCLSQITFTKNRCFQCAKRLDESGRDNIRCENCQDFNMVIYQTVAACDYKTSVRKLINRLKFADRKCIAKVLAYLLAKKISKQKIDFPEVIIPTPLYKRKLRLRGYNQSLEIAKYLGNYLGIPVIDDLCIRIKDTKEQVGLSARKRRLNMAHAFAITENANNYKHVVILDDLVISGATVRALANELAKSTIDRIDVWCISRI